MSYMDVILEAAKKRQERELHHQQVRYERWREMKEIAALLDGKPQKRMNWLPHLPYLQDAYDTNVTYEQMARQIGAVTERAITPQMVSRAMTEHGISARRRERVKAAV